MTDAGLARGWTKDYALILETVPGESPEDGWIAKIDGTTPEPRDPGSPLLPLLARASRMLTRRQAQVLVLRLRYGLTFPEIGEALGCSKQAAHLYFTNSLAKLSR